jgi:hypothetical protein
MLTRRASGPSPSRARLALWPGVLLRRRRARTLPAVRVPGVPGTRILARAFVPRAVAAAIVAAALGVQTGLHVVDIVSASRVLLRRSVVPSRVVPASVVAAPAIVPWVATPAVVPRRKTARPRVARRGVAPRGEFRRRADRDSLADRALDRF